MDPDSPLRFFTPEYRAHREAQLEQARTEMESRQSLPVRRLLRSLRASYGHPTWACILPENRIAAARHLSHWTAKTVIPAFFTRRALCEQNTPDALVSFMNAIYDVVLIELELEPGSAEDRIIRALLDNRSRLEGGAWQPDRICYLERDVATTSYRGDHGRPAQVHELYFAEGAVLPLVEYQDRTYFLDGGKRIPSGVFTNAFERILSAYRIILLLHSRCEHEGTALEERLPAIIRAIRDIHENDPLHLVSAQDFTDLDYIGLLKEKIWKPALIEEQ